MEKTVNLKQYKEEQLDKSFKKSEKINEDLKSQLARLDMKINAGSSNIQDEVWNILNKMNEMHEGQEQSRDTLYKYKK